jgi:outer membrane protein OmpA-like peptidoglycan-associated protein
METLIVHPHNKKQLTALKAFMKAFDISFEEEKSNYDPEFVKMIQQGEEDLKAGKGVRVDINNLWK